MRNLQQFVKQGTGGGCDKERGGVIQKCVFETNAQRCVEIGVFRGSSLMYFAEALEDTGGKVVTNSMPSRTKFQTCNNIS